MAGAGYKLYNTGDVLTASDVNTYIQQQTVMVFADSTARTTALSGVVAEGMLTYLKDTDVVQYYSGSGWVTVNTDQTPLTTKGDLFTYSTQDARLAVGSNGDTLVADSAATTGLRWQGNYAAGKNAIINGDYRLNQRSFSSTTSDGTYGFDRWALGTAGGTTYSAQTFTAGTAPVAGYEGINFAQVATTGQSGTGVISILLQRIEDVRTFAGQTVTISFWAKAASGTPSVAIELQQNFGSGGSTTVNTYAGKITTSTSWARYSVNVAVPGVSGKTIGASSFIALQLWTSAGSDFNARTGTLGIQTATIGFWGVQVEAGSVATAFQTATGTLQGELAACQRYYATSLGNGNAGIWDSSTEVWFGCRHPVQMRTTPSVTLLASTLSGRYNGNVTSSGSTISYSELDNNGASVKIGGWTGGVTNAICILRTNNTAAFSAEL
jgi:hypothetical protein